MVHYSTYQPTQVEVRRRTSLRVVLTERRADARRNLPAMQCVARRILPTLRTARNVEVINALTKTVYTDGAACGRTSIAIFVNRADGNRNKRINIGGLYRWGSMWQNERCQFH